MKFGIIILVFSLSIPSLASGDRLSSFVSALNLTRIFKTGIIQEVLPEHTSQYECEEYTYGAKWNSLLRRCEFPMERFIEIMQRQDGRFDVYISDSNGCVLDVVLAAKGNKLVSTDGVHGIEITVKSSTRISVNDLGLSDSECGGSADFAGFYKK